MFSATGKLPAFRLRRAARVIWETPLRLELGGMVVLGTLLTALVVAEVLLRYFLHLPQLWVEEMCLYLLFWYYLLAAAYATHNRTHMKAGVVHIFLKDKPRVLDYLNVVITLMCLGLSCLLSAWSYQVFTWSLFAKPMPRTIQLYLPLAYSQASLLVGFALMSLYFLEELVERVRGLHITKSERGSNQ